MIPPRNPKNAASASSSQGETQAPSAISVENPLFFSSRFEKLDAQSIDLQRVSWWIFAGIMASVLLFGWLMTGIVLRDVFDLLQWLGLVAILAALVATIWAASYVPHKVYETTSWQIRHGLEIRRGIWWRHRIFIPGNRIQHTDVRQGPLERRFGLATLVVNTGGTHEPSISLSGLKLSKAEVLRDQLSSGHDKSTTNVPKQVEPLQ